MKWTTMVLLTTFVLTDFAGYSQITLRKKNAPLERVLANIEKQTKFVFLFDPDDLKMGTITIDVKNASLQETLGKCFNELPIEFSVVGNNVQSHSGNTSSGRFTYSRTVSQFGYNGRYIYARATLNL